MTAATTWLSRDGDLGTKLARDGFAHLESAFLAQAGMRIDPCRLLHPLLEELEAVGHPDRVLARSHPTRKGSLIGYEKRTTPEAKSYVYYRPELRSFWERQGVLRQCPTAEAFVQHAAPIFAECMALRERVLRQLERRFAGICGRFEGGVDVLKFVTYPPRSECGVHADPSPITIHLWENRAGFFFVRDRHRTHMSPPPGQALCFLGKTFAVASGQEQPSSSHPPVYHGADACPDAARSAMVFFIRDAKTFEESYASHD